MRALVISLMLLPLLGMPQPALQPLDTLRLRVPATDIALDVANNVLTLDAVSNQIARYTRQFGKDSVVIIGGAGISGEGFLDPTVIRLANRQDIYVLDYGNRRLAILNVNLRVVADKRYDTTPITVSISEGPRYLLPLSFDIGPLGDLFLLNQEDNRIYKFDETGQPVTAFGGVGYGEGQLLNPSDVVVTRSNWVVVADTVQHTLQVFDNFGTYRYGWTAPQLPQGWRGITGAGNMLLLHVPGKAWLLTPETGRWMEVPVPSDMRTVAWNANVLAVLLPGGRLVRYAYPLPAGR